MNWQRIVLRSIEAGGPRSDVTGFSGLKELHCGCVQPSATLHGERIEKLIYMHRNPVMRGLVQAPEQWPWSSYRSYAYREEGAVRINQWDATAMKTRTPAA